MKLKKLMKQIKKAPDMLIKMLKRIKKYMK